MNILIADDHYLYIKGIRLLLESNTDVDEIYEAKDLSSVLEQLGQHPIDLLLLDLRMPDMEGFDGVYQVRKQFPDVSVTIVTSSESRLDIQTAINAGVDGYILKSLEHDQMIEALDTVIDGAYFFPKLSESAAGPLERLTKRQKQILYLINDGMGNREIGKNLGVTEGTISQHIHAILRALKVKNRSEAARILRQNG
ncbi:MAG: response regulator transcription factor [Gammaproteobacteria bacterium]|nr:response regulator transcription factor [Gammaproteobacteria bacterium]MBT4606377.1 response regulator transcription factor [Thiotrichales bacterium]MBT3472693.1 response regulator transcription factor [Gammaproteobacteria bacterium]MBT3967366.1 response regulator transcription factor [Gammaproteobacteria bacterium]MBT4081503.1 response regulator transcription factor [Gammaproteobacteria bacterium]